MDTERKNGLTSYYVRTLEQSRHRMSAAAVRSAGNGRPVLQAGPHFRVVLAMPLGFDKAEAPSRAPYDGVRGGCLTWLAALVVDTCVRILVLKLSQTAGVRPGKKEVPNLPEGRMSRCIDCPNRNDAKYELRFRSTLHRQRRMVWCERTCLRNWRGQWLC